MSRRSRTLTFCGVPIVRDPPRKKSYVLITGLEAMQLGIPWRSLKGPWQVNQDVCVIDKRRYQRALRRAKVTR